MTDNIGKDPPARKAGRGLLRALRAILGDRLVRKGRDSLAALGEEYRRGRREAEEAEAPPRRVPHRVIPGEGPPPAPEARGGSPAPE